VVFHRLSVPDTADAEDEPPARDLSYFFSSRRRHTRWPRDWSSDVCSSDLDSTGYALYRPPSVDVIMRYKLADANDRRDFEFEQRSEERRVGKECRSRWSRYT